MITLIGISGKKQSGKDYVADLFMKLNGPAGMKHAFATEVKKEVAAALGITVEQIYQNKALYRPILQWWGTEWRRNNFGDDYWIKKWEAAYRTARKLSKALIIAPDVRFPNEYATIKAHDGLLIRVVPVNQPMTAEPDYHPSETSLDNYMFDYTITNDFTDYAATLEQVKKILRKESHEP
jgi:hypothetical protein